jgi:hypothetical protein
VKVQEEEEEEDGTEKTQSSQRKAGSRGTRERSFGGLEAMAPASG